MDPRVGSTGELLPTGGFSRHKRPGLGSGRSAWRSHDGLFVISGLEQSYLPGTDRVVGPQWLLSTSKEGPARCNVTDADLTRVVAAFAMPAFDEDNHHPGIARHLWCPVDPVYRSACECKITEVAVDTDGYHWTTDRDDTCRGCDYQQLSGLPCPIHTPTAA